MASLHLPLVTVSRHQHLSNDPSLPIALPGKNFQWKYNRKICNLLCSAKKPVSSDGGDPRASNLLLQLAWYGSELIGIAASFFRPSKNGDFDRNLELAGNIEGNLSREAVVDCIKEDFQRSYFVTGNLTLNVYEEDCEFADPAGSFRGLRRFKRNCSNFGSLLEKSDMKLTKWEDLEDKGIGHWRFSCVMTFPWQPILSATGYTEYYFNAQSGRVCR
ncbi:uncharacterized protein LOC18424121 isoform X2 [Amborella trichopoda]|nr:uncharacterized protein LOC18424121 isoform X2 [Amborella trichopoda]|eukprot:XP_011628905.1 uncharacterized protein LOC18424121 isoform X2 [Amborella trichopoda]